MSTSTPSEAITVLDGHYTAPVDCPLGGGRAAIFSRACPPGERTNEDALAIVPCGDKRTVLAVADGFGGQPAGDRAARLAIEAIVGGVTEGLQSAAELREGILNGFEQANRAVTELGVGAATTLAVAEIDNGMVRTYHAGDSEIVVVGQRGKVKLQTISHSPVGYGVEAGLIHRDDAMHHDERNIVSNMIGSPEMRIDMGAPMPLGTCDRLLLGTDGIFDNLAFDEIVAIIRKGPIDRACAKLVEAATTRMTDPKPDQPSKPDDIAVVLFRLA